ncbi:hypothetical protein ABPG74_011196 [Tetrahymena malaccensis]
MKQKLGRPPLIQIEFNEGMKQPNLDNNQQQNQFSTIVNQQGLKEGNQVNSPTPNFTSPSNKQHQQQVPQGSYYFSQFHQNLAPQGFPSNGEIYHNDRDIQSQQFSNQIQPFTQYSSEQLQIFQNQNANKNPEFQKNLQNETNNSSVYQSSQSPYQSEIQNQYNDYLIEQKYQQYVSGQSNDSILKKNQSNGFDTQSSQYTNSNRDISPQIRGNQSKCKGSEVTDSRIKSIANVNKSLVRNSSSSNIVIHPQRIQVDMSEFMLKKPPQPPSNRTPSGREQNSQNNISNYNNNNANEGLLNLTPKSQYLKVATSSKSPSHKKTKSLMDFIKNGISNSTKNLNRPLKENKLAMNKKQKLNQQVNSNNTQKSTSNERNYSSNSRKQMLKNVQESSNQQNLKVSNFYSQTNRSGASTTNQTVSPLISPNTLNQQKQNNYSSNNIQVSQEKKNNKKCLNQRTKSTSNLHHNNQQIKFSPPSKKDTITPKGEINQNGILFKNSTKAISIKQKVLSDSKKQKSSKNGSRFATEADITNQNDQYEENLSEQVEINKVLKSNEQSPKKNLDLSNKMIQQNDMSESSLIYRQMMIAQSQIGKEHPTPSQIKFLQSNQKKKYFEQQSENAIDQERKDSENPRQDQQQIDNLIISQQSSNKKSSNAYGTDSLWQDNIEDSFQNQQNYHSIQKIPVSLGFNGFKQVRESQSLKSGLTQQINSLNTLNSTKNNSNYQSNLANNANNQTLPSTIENDYSTIQKVQGNFFSNSTNANQTANPILQINSQMVEPQLPQILIEQQQDDVKRSKKNESLQTSSEKHLRENYPFFLENSDSKELGRDQKDNLQKQFESMINQNEQKPSDVSLIPITNINPQYTENYLIQGNSNRILQQLQTMGSSKPNQFRKEQQGISEINQQNFKKDQLSDNEQSVMVFQSSQDTLKKEKPEQQEHGSTGLKKLNNQKSNYEISELSFEAKNIDNSLKIFSSMETNTINSLQMQNNGFNLINSTVNNNLSSSYTYNQGGMNTPKQNQNKFSVMKIIDNTSIPISRQIIKQDAFVMNKTSDSVNASPQSNQRSNKHQISPTSNAKLNKIIEQRSLSQEKSLTSKSLGYFVPQQFANKQIYVQDNSQLNQNSIKDQFNQSLVSTPYQNYSNNNLSSLNTLEKQKVSNQNLNNPYQNICHESYQMPNYQQTSVGTDRQALNLMTTPKQYNNSQALHFLTSDCSSYRVDPLYQQQVNQYTLQKSIEFQQIPETTTDLQRMQTDQSLFESYQYLPQSQNQLHSTKNQDVRNSFPYFNFQNSNKNANQTQQIGNHSYQHQFFHPIDIQLDQKENNQSFQNYNNSSEFLRQQQIDNYQKQLENKRYQIDNQCNQLDNYDKQVNEIDYGGKQLESQYLMQRLNQIQKQQQQQQYQQQNEKSRQKLSKHSNNQTVDQSKIERSFITTTEELGTELQENKMSTNRLKQHVQCLENRIRKLVNEDENLERKLQLITQRKEDMSQVKMKNKEDNFRLQNLKCRQQEQIKEMKRKISQGRIQSKERLEQSKMQLQMQKRHIANQVKEVNLSNKSLLDETRNQEALRNSFIISSIKNLERKLVEDKTNRATQALQQSKISQMNKIEQEQEQQEQLKVKIQQLEQIEQQLIDNLEQKYEQNKSFLYV